MNTKETVIERKLSFSEIRIHIMKLGTDYNIVMEGGQSPHVGCTAMAIPRPSLTGDGTISATSSVLNVTGHKDEELCRYLAETVAKRKHGIVVCTGGFHMDHATPAQIKEVLEIVQDMAEEIVNLHESGNGCTTT